MPGTSFVDPTSLSNDTLRDLLMTTMQQLPWDGQFEVLQKYHDYPIVNQWFAKDRIAFDGGVSIVRQVQVTETGGAHFTRPYTPEAPSVGDVQARLRAQWVQATHNYSISRQEMMRNRNKAKLIDLVKTRRIDCMMELANLLEYYAWQVPTSSNDDLAPMGIPYWLPPITSAQQTAGTYGHSGGNPSGFSDCGGIDASAAKNARWRTYVDAWSNGDGDIDDVDIKRITRMLRRLKFNPPSIVESLTQAGLNNLRLYSVEKIIDSLEDRARKSEASLGGDVGKFANTTVIKGIPVLWSEILDADTKNPMYAVNHDYFKPFVMEGDYLRETGPMNDREQHDVFTTFVDLQFNYICTNRQRGGGVISRV